MDPLRRPYGRPFSSRARETARLLRFPELTMEASWVPGEEVVPSGRSESGGWEGGTMSWKSRSCKDMATIGGTMAPHLAGMERRPPYCSFFICSGVLLVLLIGQTSLKPEGGSAWGMPSGHRIGWEGREWLEERWQGARAYLGY